MVTVPKPIPGQYQSYFEHYLSLVGNNNALQVLVDRATEAAQMLKAIPEDKHEYAYAEGKWTIKQVLGHVADSERIFGYRALCIARGEKASLPGFDENEFEAKANHNSRSLNNIVDEWLHIRQSNIILFSTFNDDDFNSVGMANGSPCSVAAIIYAIAGHELHHANILKERYGI
jgi:uncharacterized damage-inducible protein DinB